MMKEKDIQKLRDAGVLDSDVFFIMAGTVEVYLRRETSQKKIKKILGNPTHISTLNNTNVFHYRYNLNNKNTIYELIFVNDILTEVESKIYY